MRKVFVLVVLCAMSCSSKVDKSELVGVYTAFYRGANAMLYLNEDHSYSHVITGTEGKDIHNRSTWAQIIQNDNVSRVQFENFKVVPTYLDEQRIVVEWSTEIERNWRGEIRLCFDSDAGYCYTKQ